MTSIFSSLLLQNMEAALDNKEQVILFQNRRGFAPVQECSTCGHIPKCNKCDVSLTYHKFTNLLKCHYCGYSEKEKLKNQISIYYQAYRQGHLILILKDYQILAEKN